MVPRTNYSEWAYVEIKALKMFPDRPTEWLSLKKTDYILFDEAFLPEDSWYGYHEEDEIEVDKIIDVRSGRRIRKGRVHQLILNHWKGYSDPSLVNEKL